MTNMMVVCVFNGETNIHKLVPLQTMESTQLLTRYDTFGISTHIQNIILKISLWPERCQSQSCQSRPAICYTNPLTHHPASGRKNNQCVIVQQTPTPQLCDHKTVPTINTRQLRSKGEITQQWLILFITVSVCGKCAQMFFIVS